MRMVDGFVDSGTVVTIVILDRSLWTLVPRSFFYPDTSSLEREAPMLEMSPINYVNDEGAGCRAVMLLNGSFKHQVSKSGRCSVYEQII